MGNIKTLIIGLLLTVSPLVSARQPLKINKELANIDYSNYLTIPDHQGFNWKGAGVAAWNVGAVALEALGDGLYDNSHKVAAHSIQAASTAMLLTGPFVFDLQRSDWLPYVLNYMFMRIALFDPVYNITRGLPLQYVGNTSLWDKGLQEFEPPPHGLYFARTLFLTAGFSIPIKYIL